MEGFLRKKARGEKAVFTTNKWKIKWCELDNTVLTYYENFDRKRDEAKGKPTEINVVGATIQGLKKGSIPDHDYCFLIKLSNGKTPLTFEADKGSFKSWIDALSQAAKTPEQLKAEEEERLKDQPDNDEKLLDLDNIRENKIKYFNLLKLDPDDPNNMNQKKISKAYKRMALKHHPDKGGDHQVFDDLNRANKCLCHLIKEEEIERMHEWIEFNVSIIKGPPGEGLGIAIAELKSKKILQVKEVMSCINIVNIDSLAGDNLEEKDILICIGNDYVEKWPLRRIVARVGNFRCPVGEPVRLRFKRRVLKKEFERDAQQEEGYISPTESEVTTPRSNISTPRGSFWRSDTNVQEDEEADIMYLDAVTAFDLDAYSYDSRYSQTMSTNFSDTMSTSQGTEGLQSTMNTTTGTSSLNEPPVSPQPIHSYNTTSTEETNSAQINAMQEEIASLKEQNEKLTKENIKRQDAVSKLNALQRTLDFTQKELQEVSAVRKSLKESRELCVKLDEDKKKLKKELNSLKRKNEKLVTEMQAILLNTEEYLKRKKENNLSNESTSENRFEETKKHIQNVKKVHTDASISEESVKGHIFACTKAIDGGASMRKWATQGNNAENKLNKFQQKLTAAGIIKKEA